jgi:LysM domain
LVAAHFGQFTDEPVISALLRCCQAGGHAAANSRFTVARSRKLLFAAALLAGGYCLALLASGVSDFFWARRLVSGTGTASSSDGTSLEDGDVGGKNAAGVALLVPELAANAIGSDATKPGPEATANTTARPISPPTNLGPMPGTGSIEADADKEDYVTAAAENSKVPVISDQRRGTSVDAGMSEPRPRARVTDVKRAATVASASGTNTAGWSASPWDRWPRWEPWAAAASVERDAAPPNHAVATARSNNSVPGNVSAEPASFGQSNASPTGAASFVAPTDLSENETAQLRTHIVVDGDSLSKLAARYLDDPQLGDTIFQLNRDVLSDPDLLPIGVELKLPARRMASSSRVDRLPRDQGSPATVDSTGLLPVDRGWEPAKIAPPAQLLRPLPPTTAPTAIPPTSQ